MLFLNPLCDKKKQKGFLHVYCGNSSILLMGVRGPKPPEVCSGFDDMCTSGEAGAFPSGRA